MNEAMIKRAEEIIRQNTGVESYCVLALMDEEGNPTASTITASKAEGIRRLYFGTGLGSNKAMRIRRCGRACVCFNTGGAYNISLSGTIEIVTDTEVKADMWYDGLKNHFSGPDDPNYCVLRFTADRFNLLVDWQEATGTLN